MSKQVSLLCLVALIGIHSGVPGFAYSPESPKVKQMVAKAAAFVEKQSGGYLGLQCLLALALHKAGMAEDHRQIRAALESCRRSCKDGTIERDTDGGNFSNVYDLAVAVMFLAEVDAQAYHSEIELLTNALLGFQKRNGAWGYAERTTGDTSQVQFAVLALWTAQRVGVQVPPSAFVNACDWLIRTQDPSGYWAYQGIEATGDGDKRVTQTVFGDGGFVHSSKHSMTAAALSALYIGIDALGISVGRDPGRIMMADELPPAIKLIRETSPAGHGATKVDLARLKRAIFDGNNWLSRAFTIDPKNLYLHYYHYTYERYVSFREKSEGITEKEPKWYDAGVEFMERRQRNSGEFADESLRFGGREGTSTAFAIMFLTRGTQKTIGKLTEGALTAGMGLPADAGDIRLDAQGRIVGSEMSRSVGDLLGLLEDPNRKEELADLLRSSLELHFEGDATARSKHAAQLRNLVSHKSYEARMIAVRSMARSGDLENVPALIHALSDPDLRVVKEARDGLRFLSRKFDGFGLELQPRPDPARIKEVQGKWKQWYQSVRPDVDLELFNF